MLSMLQEKYNDKINLKDQIIVAAGSTMLYEQPLMFCWDIEKNY